MSIETEFKFRLTATEYERLVPWFRKNRAKTIRTTTSYFDTADFQLRNAGLGLRIRVPARGAAAITLKFPLSKKKTGQDGLHRRGEWEQALPSKLATALVRALEPFGSLAMERMAFRKAKAEWALDSVRVGKTQFFELEVETDNVAALRKQITETFRLLKIQPKTESRTKLARLFENKQARGKAPRARSKSRS